MKKIVTTAVVASVVVALLWFAFRPRPVDVDLAEVTRGLLEVTLDHEGKTRVVDRYLVSAALPGMLRRIDLKAGAEVTQGKVVAAIDPLEPSLLDERTLATAEAQVRAAAAVLDQTQSELDKVVEQLRLARAAYQRDLELQETNIISIQDLERTERDLRLWEGEWKSAQAAVAVARFQLEVAEAALLRVKPGVTNGELEETPFLLSSPIQGRVFRVFRESGGPVMLGDPLLELGDTRAIELVVDFLSTDAVRIERGMACVVHGWGGDLPLRGVVRLVEPSGFTKISALGVEEQRVNVIVDLEGSTEEMPPLGDGFRIEVSVIIWRGDDVLRVPEASLFRREEGWAVFRVAEGIVRATAVEIGHRSGFDAEVLTGLREGDVLVLHPSDAIEDGVEVVAR